MIDYLKAVRAEMKHVSWPSRRSVVVYTVVVTVISLATALYLGAWDLIFTELVKRVI